MQASVRCLAKFGSLVDLADGGSVPGLRLKGMTYLPVSVRDLYGYGHGALHLKEVRMSFTQRSV
jgi:hypothetical protein